MNPLGGFTPSQLDLPATQRRRILQPALPNALLRAKGLTIIVYPAQSQSRVGCEVREMDRFGTFSLLCLTV